MDEGAYTIRPFTEADYEAEARIDAEHNPGFALTAAELRHYVEAQASEPGRLNFRLAAESRESGAVVAYAALAHSVFDFHPQKFWLGVGVEKAFRRQGIGAELYARVEREAVARGATHLWGGVRDGDLASARFFTLHGFQERRRIWTSRLDLTSLDLTSFPDRTDALAKGGIRITTLAAEGPERTEVRERLYRLSVLTSKDVPRMGEYAPVSYEVFLEFDLDTPGMLKDGYFLASAEGEYVGMTFLERDSDRAETLRVGFTGIHPAFRGRGIASELKRRAAEYAREKGYRFLVTYNDSLNRPIWAINQKLGFRSEVTWIDGEKRLTSV